MTTVMEHVDLPASVTPTDTAADVQLVGADGAPLAEVYDTAAGTTIVGHHAVALSATGTWSLDLAANSALTPAGTVWRRSLAGRGISTPGPLSYATVPAAGGPYRWDEILDDPPATITATALAAHAADEDLHGGGQLLGYADRDSNFTTTSTAGEDVPGLSITFTVPDRPYRIEAGALCLIEQGVSGQASVSSGSRTSGVTTLNTSAAHGFSVGQVVIVNVADASYNGAWVINSVPTTTSLTYAQSGASDDGASGTGSVGRADQPPAGGGLIIALDDNTQIGGTRLRAGANSDLLYIGRSIYVPSHFHAPAADSTVTYKVRAQSTVATSDLELIASFFGVNDAPFIAAYTL